MPQLPKTLDILAVFTTLSRMASIERHNYSTDKNRHENVAEHSYFLATLGCALAEYFNVQQGMSLDIGKVSYFALVHDLPEIYMQHGDISVYASAALLACKKADEAQAISELRQETAALPWLAQTLDSYELQDTPEARFVYALDKLIVHMVVIVQDTHHAQPTQTAYRQTETAARHKIHQSFPELLPLFTDLCNMFQDRPHLFAKES